jgi:hypothetical protein
MNQYVFTLTSDPLPTRERTADMMNQMLPGTIEALYTHFYQPRGMVDCPTPLTISWWRSPNATQTMVALVDWDVTTRNQATESMYLAQQMASDPSTCEYLWTRYRTQPHYTRPHHEHLVRVGRFLAALAQRQLRISHTYTTALGARAGTMIGLPFTASARRWIEQSIQLAHV